MASYRISSDNWDKCSYKPEDVIYLETIFRHMYAKDAIKFAPEDVSTMTDIYVVFTERYR